MSDALERDAFWMDRGEVLKMLADEFAFEDARWRSLMTERSRDIAAGRAGMARDLAERFGFTSAEWIAAKAAAAKAGGA